MARSVIRSESCVLNFDQTVPAIRDEPLREEVEDGAGAGGNAFAIWGKDVRLSSTRSTGIVSAFFLTKSAAS